MDAKVPESVSGESSPNEERRRQEIEWTLNAIAGAIAADKLPPDDAFAWARIAAYEANALSAEEQAECHREAA
jgi:hypothetical protein